jgi:hypothetical protein
LNKWTGSELTAVAFYDAPLHVVSLNIVKNFILFGDIHKSIYFLSWKEQGSQLSLLAKDFGSLDSFATEFLIDGSTLSLVVSDSDKNLQVSFCLLYTSAEHYIRSSHTLRPSNCQFAWKEIQVNSASSRLHWQLEASYFLLLQEWFL